MVLLQGALAHVPTGSEIFSCSPLTQECSELPHEALC
jgi:hypothetical protein